MASLRESLALTLTVSVLLAVLTAAQETPPTATVTQGTMRGVTMTSRKGATFYAFRGIPYAQPPVGQLRFQVPVPAGPWEGELDATKDAPSCVQKNYLIPNPKVEGQEDCLFLNVYTPKMTPPFGLLPVMVYIHGGAWFTGSGASYLLGPNHIMDQDVVLVTFNYRLGALGFLSTGDDEARGNYAMKDQVEVLRWVNANIAVFGGDPSVVTLFGQSAGSASVHMHMLSPLSAGLFHRAISQSGSALSIWAYPQDPWPMARTQAQLLGCPEDSSAALVECLRNVDAANLTDSGDHFHFWSVDPLVVYKPVIERGPGAFLTDDPFTLIQMGAIADVPWMHGAVGQEGLLRALQILLNTTLLSDLNANIDVLLPPLMQLQDSAPPELQFPIWKNISDYYFGSCNIQIGETNQQKFIDLYSDRSILQGFHKSAMLHAQTGHNKQYLYRFNYRGLYSYTTLFANTTEDYGVNHCDDLIYLFSSPVLFPSWPPNHADLQVIDNLVLLWTNFAKYGNPTPPTPENTNTSQQEQHGLRDMDDAPDIQFVPTCTDIKSIIWEPVIPHQSYDKDSYQLWYLDINANPNNESSDTLQFCMRKDFNKDRLDFWESLPLRENKESSYLQYLMPLYYIVGLLF